MFIWKDRDCCKEEKGGASECDNGEVTICFQIIVAMSWMHGDNECVHILV